MCHQQLSGNKSVFFFCHVMFGSRSEAKGQRLPFLFHLINNDFQAAARSGERIVPNAASLGIWRKPGPLMAFRCRLPQPTRWAVRSIKAKKKKKGTAVQTQLQFGHKDPNPTCHAVVTSSPWGGVAVALRGCVANKPPRRDGKRGRTSAWHKSKFITVGGGNWSSGDGRNRLCWGATSTCGLSVGRDFFSCLGSFFF